MLRSAPHYGVVLQNRLYLLWGRKSSKMHSVFAIYHFRQITAVHQDLMCFSRVLNVVAHYDAGLDYELETQVKQTYKFLLKMDELQAVQKEMIRFMRSLTDIYPNELKQAFRQLHASLKRFENDPYEKRSFLYLDILSWLESKIENRSIGEVIREKASLLIR